MTITKITTTEKTSLPAIVQDALEETLGLKGEKENKKWKEVALGLGITEGVLRNKVAKDKNEKRHHISLAEALTISKITMDNSLLHAICEHSGGVFVQRPIIDVGSDDELLMRYTSMMNELGKFSIDIHESLKDQKISASEISNLRKDFLHLTVALSEVMDRLQIKAERDASLGIKSVKVS
jgi:hypothetical protein